MKEKNQSVCEIDEYGTKWWRLNGQLHRENGPSIEYLSGTKTYHLHGQLHRIDGPAVEYFNGAKYWYYYDRPINCRSQEEFKKLIKLKALW